MSARDKFVVWKDRTAELLERYDRYVTLVHVGGGTPPPPFSVSGPDIDDEIDGALSSLSMRIEEWITAAEVRARAAMEAATTPKKQRVPRRAAKGARR